MASESKVSLTYENTRALYMNSERNKLINKYILSEIHRMRNWLINVYVGIRKNIFTIIFTFIH